MLTLGISGQSFIRVVQSELNRIISVSKIQYSVCVYYPNPSFFSISSPVIGNTQHFRFLTSSIFFGEHRNPHYD
jgi:hypothetical protein